MLLQRVARHTVVGQVTRLAKLEDAHELPGDQDFTSGKSQRRPADVERANANLVGGHHLGGSHHRAEHFLFHQVPGWSGGPNALPLAVHVRGRHIAGRRVWAPAAATSSVTASEGRLVASLCSR